MDGNVIADGSGVLYDICRRYVDIAHLISAIPNLLFAQLILAFTALLHIDGFRSVNISKSWICLGSSSRILFMLVSFCLLARAELELVCNFQYALIHLFGMVHATAVAEIRETVKKHTKPFADETAHISVVALDIHARSSGMVSSQANLFEALNLGTKACQGTG